MRLQAPALIFTSLLTVAGCAAASGVVDVAFADSNRYTDAGTSQSDKEANLKLLGDYLQQLGARYLRNEEVLKVEVLDVDLAGRVEPWRRSGADMRIVRAMSDWPRISLRYSLESSGKTVRSATDQVADMNYTRGFVDIRSPHPLQYEKRMLEKWFKEKFAEP